MPRLKRFKSAPPDATSLVQPNDVEARSVHSIGSTHGETGFVRQTTSRAHSGHSVGGLHGEGGSTPAVHSNMHDGTGFLKQTTSRAHSGHSAGGIRGGGGSVSAVHSNTHRGTGSMQQNSSEAHAGHLVDSVGGGVGSIRAVHSHKHGEANSGPSNGSVHGGASSSSSDHRHEYSDSSEEDDPMPSFGRAATKSKKKTSYWIVELIDVDGNITEGRLKVQDIWTISVGKKIILPCNVHHQPIDDAGAMLGAFLGDLASDFGKLPICYRTWRKVPDKYKNSVYDGIIEKKFQVLAYRTKEWIIQNLGRKWKDARCALFHRFASESLTVEENIARRPLGIDVDQWIWFIHYWNEKKTKAMCQRNTENRQKLLYPHTAGSKSFARLETEENRRRDDPVSRGEFWIITHQDENGSYINEAAKTVGEKIEEAERQEGCPKHISPNASLAQVLGKEHPGRVRGLGFGPCPSQVFGQTTHRFNGTSSAQFGSDPKIEEMKLKMHKLEEMVESERSRRRTFEKLFTGFLIQQSGQIPAKLAALLNAMAWFE